MNKQILSMAALAGIFLFTACSDDEKLPAMGGSDSTVSEIKISLDSGGEEVTTRAGRPVNSSAAANSVDKVQLKVYKSNGSAWEEDMGAEIVGAEVQGILSWSGPTGEGTPGSTVRNQSKTVKLKNLTAGSYRIVAYGYQTDHGYANPTFDATSGVFTTPQIIYAPGDNGTNVEELFAGSADFAADANGKITSTEVEVTMLRQVAGLLGYFKNIPVMKANADGAVKAVRYVKVKTVSQTKQFTFPSTQPYNGTAADAEGEYVLLTYDLSALLGETAYNQQVTEAGEDLTKVFTIAAQATTPVTVANSILAGRYIVPFAAAINQNTLQVDLEDADENVLRSWDIRITNASTGTTPTDTEALQYNIQRNKFYSIGRKLKSDSTNGGTTDPDTDDDKPVDLNNDNDIIVILNDAWDVIYDMSLGD